MSVTDFITLILSFYFMVRGSLCGFVNSLINPFSIIVCTIISIIYYQNTKNIIISLVIGVLGPLLLNYLLRTSLRAWSRATNTDVKPNLISRLAGAFVSLTWGWIFIIFILILLTSLPASFGKKWTDLHNDVINSASYVCIAKPLEKNFFALFNISPPDQSNKTTADIPAAPIQNNAAASNISSSPDARSLALDPRFQKTLQDPEVQSEINSHDIVKLMSNPKMMALTQQIMSDPATMKKVFALYNAQAQSQASPEITNSSN